MPIFQELLRIKEFREEKAELAVSKQRFELAHANQKRDEAETEVTRFRKYAVQHEKKLFDDLCNPKRHQEGVKLRDIEDVQLAVVDLRKGENERETKLTKATEKRDQEDKQLLVVQKMHLEASKNKQKFIELAQVYAEEEFKELERKEDLELEEVASIAREKEDWGNPTEEG